MTPDEHRRRRLLEAADRIAGSIPDDETPGWNTPDEILEWVRALRREADGRLQPGDVDFSPRP
jgi:hypothetical protein